MLFPFSFHNVYEWIQEKKKCCQLAWFLQFLFRHREGNVKLFLKSSGRVLIHECCPCSGCCLFGVIHVIYFSCPKPTAALSPLNGSRVPAFVFCLTATLERVPSPAFQRTSPLSASGGICFPSHICSQFMKRSTFPFNLSAS